MGLHRKDGRLFAMIYNSITLSNILANPVAAANIVDEPVLFVKSALSDLGVEDFEYINGFPVLKNSLGWVIFDCTCKKGDNISVVEMIPVKGKIHRKVIKPVNRGFNAVIEASIHATRYVGKKGQEYLRQIEYCNTIVKKCGGAREKEAMKMLYELIGYPE
ncbi:MAG: DUF447 family protein [Candidatus Methanoperedens sp.]|nr:DUF447 family protein [Candidatus Methanoperedens sp.]